VRRDRATLTTLDESQGLILLALSDLSIEDRLEIQDLVVEYAWLLDHRRWHEVAGLCTDDAELLIRGRKIVGQAGLAEWADGRAAKKNRKTQHQMTLLRVTPTGADQATGTAGLALHMAKSGGGTYVELVGEYEDEYVRTPSGWKFRRRRLVNLEDS
jgi:3-phenylpropionate/cinnamic acid dioxygenase small subunit